MSVTRYALIPTHNRHGRLAALVKSLKAQGCEQIVVIDNASDPPLSMLWLRLETGVTATVIRDDEQPPNLYRLWNLGFDVIGATAAVFDPTWDVVVLNDDTELPAGWLEYVTGHLRAAGAAVACTDPYGVTQAPLLKVKPDGVIQTRMCPWAFVIRGELSLRADENFRWWWGDTDLDWQACAAGGVLLLPGYTTRNTGANSSTVGELAAQAGRDGEYFARKWGARPW